MRRRWQVLLGIAALVVVLGGAVVLMTSLESDGAKAPELAAANSTSSGSAGKAQTAKGASVTPTPGAATSGSATPAAGGGSAAAAATPSEAAVAAAYPNSIAASPGNAVARLRIPRIGVDASIVTLSLGADGTMPAPSKPMEVATYNFAALPGHIGNVVLAAHVDMANFGPAVFYRLRELSVGDEFTVSLSDGTYYSYRVSTVAMYDEDTAPVAEIVGPTSTETATLITCAGSFDHAAHAYDQRLVIRADRVA